MMRARLSIAFIAVLLIAGCNSTSTTDRQVRSQYDKSTAFHNWKTYRFASDSKGGDHTRYPRYERMTQESLEQELNARGYTRIQDGAPDFRVAFDLIFRGKTTPKVTPEGGGADPMPSSYGGSSQRGTLVVKMLDPTTGEILWSGQISEIKINVIEPQKELRKAVWRILVEFPPLTG